jgi:hypothetical protein
MKPAPAQAGVQKALKRLDSRLRGNDEKGRLLTSHEFIKFRAFVIRFSLDLAES